MKIDRKNLLIAMATSALVTGILAAYMFLFALPPLFDAMNGEGSQLSLTTGSDSYTESMIQMIQIRLITGMMIGFCILTIIGYAGLENRRKRKIMEK